MIKEEKKGELGFYNAEGRQVLVMKYKPGNLSVTIEEKLIDDKRLMVAWGGKLYRLTLVIKKGSLSRTNNFEFSIPKK